MKSERISPFWVNGYQPFSAVIILGAEVFVTIAWGVLLEEAGKVFQGCPAGSV